MDANVILAPCVFQRKESISGATRYFTMSHVVLEVRRLFSISSDLMLFSTFFFNSPYLVARQGR